MQKNDFTLCHKHFYFFVNEFNLIDSVEFRPLVRYSMYEVLSTYNYSYNIRNYNYIHLKIQCALGGCMR